MRGYPTWKHLQGALEPVKQAGAAGVVYRAGSVDGTEVYTRLEILGCIRPGSVPYVPELIRYTFVKDVPRNWRQELARKASRTHG